MAVEIVVCGVPFGTPAEKEGLRQLKEAGVTSVQMYTFWRDFESAARGQFSWDELDRRVQLIADAGLKFVPFILMGPRYAAPGWWLAGPDHVGLKCLEHDKVSPVESVWNPAFQREISRVLEALAEHYLPWEILESVQPGICGDYGEAIFPVLGNWPGAYHTHRGFWCGGADARKSFREYLKERYSSLDSMNKAWRTTFGSYEQVQPMLPEKAPSRTAWFDNVSWYRESMTRYSEFWMKECRRVFPKIPAYLCTGGSDDEVMSGALFAAQAKVAAKHGGGVRLTNEANKFSYNFPLTTHTHAACEFYGAYLGLEPVGPMTEAGVRTRMYSTAAFGNRQVFHYYRNLFDMENRPLPAIKSISNYAGLLREQPAEKGIALFWPIDQGTLNGTLGAELHDALLHIRGQYPVSAISEEMILDGALKDFKTLVMFNAVTTRGAVLKRIAAWVEGGGLLLSVGRTRDLELEAVPEFDAVFGFTAESEETWGHHTQHMKAPDIFKRLSKIPGYHSEKAWLNLAPEAELISSARHEKGGGAVPITCDVMTMPVSALFRRTYASGGQAIFYSGPIRFKADPEAMFADPGVILALLDDLCSLSGIAPLHTQADEIARTRIGGKMLILKPDGIVVETAKS